MQHIKITDENGDVILNKDIGFKLTTEILNLIKQSKIVIIKESKSNRYTIGLDFNKKDIFCKTIIKH